LNVGHGHENERAPAHAQQALHARCAAWHPVHAIGDLLAEVEQLADKRVERLALRDGAGEQSDGAAARIFADVLQIVSELKEHAPFEGEADFMGIEPRLGETGVGED